MVTLSTARERALRLTDIICEDLATRPFCTSINPQLMPAWFEAMAVWKAEQPRVDKHGNFVYN